MYLPWSTRLYLRPWSFISLVFSKIWLYKLLKVFSVFFSTYMIKNSNLFTRKFMINEKYCTKSCKILKKIACDCIIHPATAYYIQKMLWNANVLFISIVMQHAGFQEVKNKVKFYFKQGWEVYIYIWEITVFSSFRTATKVMQASV